MLEKLVARLIEYQIRQGTLEQKDKGLYQYGYQILFEYIFNALAAVLIAAVFHAYGTVLVFTIAFMLVRSYSGGYHAGTGIGCFVMSALMQIAVIFAVRGLCSFDFAKEIGAWERLELPEGFFLTEIFLLPYIFRRVPVPVKNKPVSENERLHFRKCARLLYILELAAGIFFLRIHQAEYAMAVLCAHLIIFLLIFFHCVWKHKK